MAKRKSSKPSAESRTGSLFSEHKDGSFDTKTEMPVEEKVEVIVQAPDFSKQIPMFSRTEHMEELDDNGEGYTIDDVITVLEALKGGSSIEESFRKVNKK